MSFDLTIERSIPVSIDKAWNAWTDPKLLPEWAWAGIGSERTATVDLCVGGAYRCSTVHDNETWAFHGAYEVVEVPNKLTATLRWEAEMGYPPGTERIHVTLKDNGDGTTAMSFHHEGIPIEDAIAPHTAGWSGAFNDMDKLLTGS